MQDLLFRRSPAISEKAHLTKVRYLSEEIPGALGGAFRFETRENKAYFVTDTLC